MAKIMRKTHIALAVSSSFFAAASFAAINTYTENDSSCDGCIALGYEPPQPVNSQTPVNGFRTYDSLQARLMGFAAAHPFVSMHAVGTTLNNRPIRAYIISDAGNTTSEGQVLESAIYQNGGIHAREWQSPEVVTGVIERLVENANDSGFHQYLIENVNMVFTPVLNVDGFLQTQRHPLNVLETEFSGEPANFPRDGRMRRKNMRGADEVLDANADGMQGVDNNRNNNPYWATNSQRSSSDPRSIVHHGSAPASEAENQALQAAANLGPANRLRFYMDSHSFSSALFAAYTGNSRRNAIQDNLAQAMQAVNSFKYCYADNRICAGNPTRAGVGIGSTDEYFANTFQIPAFTLEIEPGGQGSSQYGGNGVTHDGFILPNSEIARVRSEIANANLLAFYQQSGPPALIAAEIRETGTQAIKLSATRTPTTSSTRSLSYSTQQNITPGVQYQLWLNFNKPMRVRSGGLVANYAGRNVPLQPTVVLEGVDAGGNAFSQTLPAGNWLNSAGGAPDGFSNYQDDAYSVTFTVNSNLPLANARLVKLRVTAQDLSGHSLDADPSDVVDWANGGWTNYQNSTGVARDSGGDDQSIRLVDDGSSLFSTPTTQSGGGSGGSFSLLSLLYLLVFSSAARVFGKRSSY